MASLYLEHGIYTYSATPTWGTAQDGDGTAKGAATPATVSIDLSAYTAAATNTISIGGATLTCVASGATTNQFNAGSGTTLIDNIVTGINRTTNTVTVSAAATNWGTPKIQDCFWARRNGNNLEIMTRAGSATYNSNSSFKVVTSGFTGGSQIDQQFANGAGGAWGWMANDRTVGAIWPSAIAKYTYGVPFNNCMAGVQAVGDIVQARANNSTIYSELAATTATITFKGPAAVLVDNGTIWSGDTGTFSFEYYLTGTTNTWSIVLAPATTSITVYLGAREIGKLLFKASTTAAAAGSSFSLSCVNNGGRAIFENIECIDSSTQSSLLVGQTSNPGGNSLQVNGLKHTVTRNAFYSPLKWQGANDQQAINFRNVELNFPNYTGTTVALLDASNNVQTSWGNYVGRVDGLKVNCPATVNTINVNLTFNLRQRLIFENIVGCGIGNLAGLFGASGGSTQGFIAEEGQSRVLHQNFGAHREFRDETMYYLVEWLYGQGYATLDATQPNGDAWAFSVQWATTHPPGWRSEFLKLTKTNNSNTNDEVVVDILVSSGLASLITYGHLSARVTYVRDSDGAVVVTPVKTLGESTALPSGSSGWSKGSYSTYVAKRLVVSLPSVIKADTEVEVNLSFLTPPPTATTERIFVNPEALLQ